MWYIPTCQPEARETWRFSHSVFVLTSQSSSGFVWVCQEGVQERIYLSVQWMKQLVSGQICQVVKWPNVVWNSWQCKETEDCTVHCSIAVTHHHCSDATFHGFPASTIRILITDITDLRHSSFLHLLLFLLIFLLLLLLQISFRCHSADQSVLTIISQAGNKAVLITNQ